MASFRGSLHPFCPLYGHPAGRRDSFAGVQKVIFFKKVTFCRLKNAPRFQILKQKQPPAIRALRQSSGLALQIKKNPANHMCVGNKKLPEAFGLREFSFFTS
jgi:hypothetical protein